MQISFDGVSLMSGAYKIEEWDIENVDNRDLVLYGLARHRGQNLLLTDYAAKKFKMAGSIIGSSQADLEQKIDELKELLQRTSRPLDYDYAGGTRRIIATTTRLSIPRRFYNVTFANFEAELIAPDGVAYATELTTIPLSAVSDLVKTGTFTILGSTSPDVALKLTLTAENAITELSLLVNGDKITLNEAFSVNDVIIFDQRTLKVTVNGVEKDYTGIFPEFQVGANAYQITAVGTSLTYDAELSYTKTYI